MARTISLQLEGSWAAVPGVVVDKVGRYAYAAGGGPGAPPAPLLVDVALDVRAKARHAAQVALVAVMGVAALAALGEQADCSSLLSTANPCQTFSRAFPGQKLCSVCQRKTNGSQ